MATGDNPSSRHARIIRSAISPRFAISTRSIRGARSVTRLFLPVGGDHIAFTANFNQGLLLPVKPAGYRTRQGEESPHSRRLGDTARDLPFSSDPRATERNQYQD